MVYNSTLLPVGFGDPDAEYRRLTQGVALWDVTCERQVEIVGPDAHRLVQFLSARDLSKQRVGRARYGPMCDFDGRLINDPVVLRLAEDRFWLSIADSQIVLWANAIARMGGYDVSVFDPNVSPLAIQGPLALDLARDLFGDIADSLAMFHHAPVELDGIPIELCRSGWSKQGGFELFLCDESRGNDLWDLVMAAGAPYDIGPGGPNAQERLESGLLSYGGDHDADTDPIEAGLGAFTDVDGPEFLGQIKLKERLERPVRRPLVNVTLTGMFEPLPRPRALTLGHATLDGDAVGAIRAAAWSPRLDAWIGIAQVTTPHDAAGTVLHSVAESGRAVEVTVSDEPFGAIRTH